MGVFSSKAYPLTIARLVAGCKNRLADGSQKAEINHRDTETQRRKEEKNEETMLALDTFLSASLVVFVFSVSLCLCG
jgi:PBP1b-binding outer membrane lipoprotein LpoB